MPDRTYPTCDATPGGSLVFCILRFLGLLVFFCPCRLSDLSSVHGRTFSPIRHVIPAPFRMDRRRWSLLHGSGGEQIPVAFWGHPGRGGKRRSPHHCRHGTQFDRNPNGQRIPISLHPFFPRQRFCALPEARGRSRLVLALSRLADV